MRGNDGQVVVAEAILRQARYEDQTVEVAAFVVYSTNSEPLPPGETIVRRANLARAERASWTLAVIHYY